MTPEQESIIELAEVIKELIRIQELTFQRITPEPMFQRQTLERRLEMAYKKATTAKNRIA